MSSSSESDVVNFDSKPSFSSTEAHTSINEEIFNLQIQMARLALDEITFECPKTLAPFSIIAAPTAASKSSPQPTMANKSTTFTKFPELPTELRYKIWHFAIPDPQVLHINYDVLDLQISYRPIYCYANDFLARGKWKIENGITTIANLHVCQEARAETQRAIGTYTPIRLAHDVTQACLFNFDTDTIFLDTNTYRCNGAEVLPPIFPLQPDFREKLRWMAVSRYLWEDWEFEDDWGSEVTCEQCLGWGIDITHVDFIEQILYHGSLEKFQVVINSYIVDTYEMSDIRFVRRKARWLSDEERTQTQQDFADAGSKHKVQVEDVDVDESRKHRGTVRLTRG